MLFAKCHLFEQNTFQYKHFDGPCFARHQQNDIFLCQNDRLLKRCGHNFSFLTIIGTFRGRFSSHYAKIWNIRVLKLDVFLSKPRIIIIFFLMKISEL